MWPFLDYTDLLEKRTLCKDIGNCFIPNAKIYGIFSIEKLSIAELIIFYDLSLN